jgi:putative ABC transport system substrate-binding protein
MADPVVTGLVASLARLGGNVTGVSVDAGREVWTKRIELLKEVVPHATRVGVIATKENWENIAGVPLRKAAELIGIPLVSHPMKGIIDEAEYRRVFDAMRQEQIDAVIVSGDSENLTNRNLIIKSVEGGKLPAIYPFHSYIGIGGLMAYAFDLDDAYRRLAGYVDHILKGTEAHDAVLRRLRYGLD